MQIRVFVKPNAKSDSVEKTPDNVYQIRLKAKPQNGEANQRLIEIIAEYFQVAKSSVNILKGHTSRQKLVEIKTKSKN